MGRGRQFARLGTAREWINSDRELVAAAGWSTWITLISITPDAELELAELKHLLQRVQKTIHAAPNAVRERMNWFVIAAGSFVGPLNELALAVGEKIGRVSIDVGDTACGVPFAPEDIRKVAQRGSIGKKNKSAKC